MVAVVVGGGGVVVGGGGGIGSLSGSRGDESMDVCMYNVCMSVCM